MTVTTAANSAQAIQEIEGEKSNLLLEAQRLYSAGSFAEAIAQYSLPRQQDKSLDVYAVNGTVKLVSLKAHELPSAWPPTPEVSKTVMK